MKVFRANVCCPTRTAIELRLRASRFALATFCMRGTAPMTNVRRLALLAPLAAVSLAGCGINSVPTAEEKVNAAWGNLQADYQRRSDLIPTLVETVKGYAAQEKSVLIQVTEARAKAGSVQLSASDL